MSRSAKVPKVIPLETPDNSSSEEENENDQEELQVIIIFIISLLRIPLKNKFEG